MTDHKDVDGEPVQEKGVFVLETATRTDNRSTRQGRQRKPGSDSPCRRTKIGNPGVLRDGFVEIEKGVRPGDWVVVSGMQRLKNDDKMVKAEKFAEGDSGRRRQATNQESTAARRAQKSRRQASTTSASDPSNDFPRLRQDQLASPAVFSRFFIDRPIFATVLSIAITLAGAISLATCRSRCIRRLPPRP